jgi:hypothetical protein
VFVLSRLIHRDSKTETRDSKIRIVPIFKTDKNQSINQRNRSKTLFTTVTRLIFAKDRSVFRKIPAHTLQLMGMNEAISYQLPVVPQEKKSRKYQVALY